MFASWVTSRSHWAIQREDRSLKYCLTNLLLIEVWFVWSRHRRGLHLTASEEISFGVPFYRERNDLDQVFEACRERNHLNEIKRSRSGFDSQWNSEMMKLVLFDTFREKIAHIACNFIFLPRIYSWSWQIRSNRFCSRISSLPVVRAVKPQ